MKKSVKKTLSTILALTVIGGSMMGATSCGKEENDLNTLYVSIINKGYGTEWMNTLMGKFLQSDAKYANYDYEIINSYDDETTKTQVESGAEYCNYDLVFHGGNSNHISETYLADLSSVYDMSYKDSILSSYLQESVISLFERKDENGNVRYNSIPWTSSGSGILVNYDLVNAKLGADWEKQYPCRTTEEFLVFIKALKDKGVAPFVITPEDHFYHPMYETWWAQYEGMAGVENYYKALYTDVNGDVVEGPEAFLQPGILQSLKVMEKIFTVENNYALYGTSFAMETAYMEGKGAMIVNGSWMKNEQVGKNGYNAIDMRFIKTPVISALGVKLGLSEFTTTTGENVADVNYTISNESKFIEVIDYVDAVLAGNVSVEKPAGVSEAVLEEVKDARRMVYSELDYSNACVPSYSLKKDVSIEFLKWMYSDAGHKEYISAMGGLFLPVKNTLAQDASIALDGFAASHRALTENALSFEANYAWKFAKTSLVPVTARNKR